MFEDLLNAFQNFRLNKTRAILSLLGVIIGVAAVIIITTLGQSATQNIAASWGNAGLDLITVSSGQVVRRSRGSIPLYLNESFREELWDTTRDLKTIFYQNSISATLRYGVTEVSATTTAVENGYLQTVGGELAQGEWFSISDNVTGRQKIILGHDVAESFFPDGNAVGKVITLDMSRTLFGFEIIGVLEDNEGSMWENFNSTAYVPRGFYLKKINPNPSSSGIKIQVLDQNEATKISEEITEYYETKFGTEDVLSVWSLTTQLETFNETMGIMSLLLSGIAAISLLVGGIGIMNIMIVTVTERKKEIGIRKALGATPNAIRGQFLVEAGTITLMGGTIGILFGIILSFIVTKILAWPFAIQWSAVALAFLFSVFVGVFFGYNPASRASKLDPVEALASE